MISFPNGYLIAGLLNLVLTMASYDQASGYTKIKLFEWIYHLTKIKKPRHDYLSWLAV